ncbi:MAG TPA: serine/threonine-protein kinase [Kofleriaceae bacterium]|nr:serine/threonine-protein kinase [Kofleriaceae bacterium]
MSVEVMPLETEESPLDHLIGQTLASRYQIVSRIGEGAMGTVFKARHVKVGRFFAVKVLHPRLLEDAKLAQRFEREAELAGRLRHPNVIGVVDVGETAEGLRYMVMDFAKGSDLATLMVEAPMKPERIIHLTRQLLEGLYHAHEQGLIHRDFKPENVIVERDDHGNEVPRIVDFGIAILREGGDSTNSAGRLTTNGLVLGTPHYMAPEQAVADPIDHRIDLFALGIVIYEMLSGRLPFDGSGAEVARANLLLDPPRIAQRVPYLEVDPLLEAFARKLMTKKRDDRPANAKRARELLDLIARDRSAAAAALGVPIATGTRLPAVTQDATPPVAKIDPAELDDELSGEYEAPSASGDVPHGAAKALRASALEAPRAAAVAVRKPSPLPAPAAETTDSADPLVFDRPRRSRTWLYAAVAAFALAAGATAVVLSRDGDPATPTPPPAPAIVAHESPVPPPAATPAPAPEPPAKAPVVEPEPAGSAAPPPTSPTLATKPTPPKKLVKPKPKTGLATVVDTKPVPTKPVETKPPDPPPSEVTAAEVQSLYGQVGSAIARLNKAGTNQALVDDALSRYRLIKIQEANTPAKREAAAAELRRLLAKLK